MELASSVWKPAIINGKLAYLILTFDILTGQGYIHLLTLLYIGGY